MYTIRNADQENGVFTLPGHTCYENKLMVGSIPNAQHPSETIYLNVHNSDTLTTRNNLRWYQKYSTYGRLIDFMLTIIIVGFTVFVEFGYIPHINQGFYCADPAISHQFAGDTITVTALAVVTFLGPVPVIYVVERNRIDGGVCLRKMWLWFRGYLISLISFLILCQTLKVTTGEHRPHFLHTCAPDAVDTCSTGSYVTKYTCQNTFGSKGYIVPDSSLSFPSGHAGIATITSLFCAVLIQMRFNSRRMGVLIKPTLCTIVLAWSFIVSISRVLDHRHHWWDVLAGTILGLVFAVYSMIFYCNSFHVMTNEVNNTNSTFKSAICGSSQIISSKDCSPSKHHSNNISIPPFLDVNNKNATSLII